MSRPRLSVVITTRDRAALVGRAIQSALSQDWPGLEVIVVDDGSRDATPELVRGTYPEVRYLRQATSQGPGPARNCGIRAAVNEWVLILDDDDTLLPQALARVGSAIEGFPAAREYPVLQFARTNGIAPQEHLVARLHDYLSEALRGDFTPVIQARLFTQSGLAYPSLRVGAEDLLWWEVAERYGIPTWAMHVAHVGTDAPLRLTSLEHQLASAPEYARLQEVTLQRFGELLAVRYPDLYVKKRLGAAAYWLLAGERGKARMHLRQTLHGRHILYSLALWGLSVAPRTLTRTAFSAYRRSLAT